MHVWLGFPIRLSGWHAESSSMGHILTCAHSNWILSHHKVLLSRKKKLLQLFVVGSSFGHCYVYVSCMNIHNNFRSSSSLVCMHGSKLPMRLSDWTPSEMVMCVFSAYTQESRSCSPQARIYGSKLLIRLSDCLFLKGHPLWYVCIATDCQLWQILSRNEANDGGRLKLWKWLCMCILYEHAQLSRSSSSPDCKCGFRMLVRFVRLITWGHHLGYPISVTELTVAHFVDDANRAKYPPWSSAHIPPRRGG